MPDFWEDLLFLWLNLLYYVAKQCNGIAYRKPCQTIWQENGG
ncbi:MAG: DUF594 domain-containing protein [Paludibacter sp.]|nr:DUF594 domain-containing protein [Paludibacter sp.]